MAGQRAASHRLSGTSKPCNNVCTGSQRAYGNRKNGTSKYVTLDITPHRVTQYLSLLLARNKTHTLAIMNIGLVVAQQDDQLNELRRFLLDDSAESIDLFLFPECYLNADQLTETSKVMKSTSKWLITSYTDKRKPDKYETGVVFNRSGKIVGEHSKTTPTGGEREEGFKPGKNITAVDTEFGKVGVCVCYEMHFPEIAREYRLQGAKLIFNPNGTEMFNEEQYKV